MKQKLILLFIYNKRVTNIKMVCLIPVVINEVDNVVFANATIDNTITDKLDGLPVAVPVDTRQYLIGEKLSLCFKIREACSYGNTANGAFINNSPKILCCLALSASCGYLIYCMHLTGPQCCS